MGFVYDYQGQRVKKIGSSTTVYIGKLYEIMGGASAKYILAGKKRIARKTLSAIYYYHKDHLQSSNVITGGSGSVEEEIHYFPYGQTRIDTGGPNVRHKYTGQELDTETGLYYYGARYYDPVLARFITPDSIVPDQEDPQSLNRYSYARNNPIYYTDPEGHLFTPYHFINTFISELLRNPPWIAAKIAAYDFNVDLVELTVPKEYRMGYQDQAVNSNEHNMMGYDPNLGRYQTSGELSRATNELAWSMYETGNQGGVHHLINDWVHSLWGDKLNDMDWYSTSFLNKALHTLIIDLNPINWGISLLANIAYAVYPSGTLELLYGPKPEAQASSYEMEANTYSNVGNSSGSVPSEYCYNYFNSYDYSYKYYNYDHSYYSYDFYDYYSGDWWYEGADW